MLLLFFFELCLVVLILAIFITQIIIPFLRGTSLFPIFKKEAILLEKLEEEKQKVVEKRIVKEINKLKNN
jgi:septation ring formation regulator EzrA